MSSPRRAALYPLPDTCINESVSEMIFNYDYTLHNMLNQCTKVIASVWLTPNLEYRASKLPNLCLQGIEGPELVLYSCSTIVIILLLIFYCFLTALMD